MNRKQLIKYFFFVVSAVGLWFLPCTAVWAATSVTLDADATILQKITVTETIGLNSGRIERPTSGSTTYIMSFNGNLNIFGGSGGGTFIDGQQPGLFTLTGNADSTYTISSTGSGLCTGTDGGVTFSATLEKTSGTFTAGSDTVAVGFIIILKSSATSDPGSFCPYTLDVNY